MNKNVMLLALFCLSVVVRLIIFFGVLNKNNNCWMYPDSVQYNATAQQLFAGNGFANEQGRPQMYRLPGYPLFLASVYKIKGDTNIVCPLLVQVVIASFIPVLLVTLASVLFPVCSCLPWCAGAWAAVDPGLVLYAGMVTTETLFTLLFLLFLLLFLPLVRLRFWGLIFKIKTNVFPGSQLGGRDDVTGTTDSTLEAKPLIQPSPGVACGEDGTLRLCSGLKARSVRTAKSLIQSLSKDEARLSSFFIAGLLLGCASLVRPVGHYLLFISCALMFASVGTLRQRLQHIIVCSGGWLIVVAPWLIRNFMLTGALFFHTLPGHHFLQYMAGYTLMEQEKKEFGQIRPLLLFEWEEAIKQEEMKSGAVCNDWQRCCLAEKIAWSYVKKYPLSAGKVATMQMTKTCFSLYSAQPLLSDSAIWPAYTTQTSIVAKIKRFLFPPTQNWFLLFFIYLELFLHLFLWLGLLLFCLFVWRRKNEWDFVCKTLPFIGLFIFLTLAYGCARLRLPIEPFLILYACRGWLWTRCSFCAKNDGF